MGMLSGGNGHGSDDAKAGSFFAELVALLTSETTKHRQDERERYRNAAIVEFLSSLRNAPQFIELARSNEAVQDLLRYVADQVSRYLSTRVLNPAAAAQAEVTLAESISEIRQLSFSLRDTVQNQGKERFKVNLRRRRVEPLEQRVSRADLVDELDHTTRVLAGITQQAGKSVGEALELRHLLRLLTGQEKSVRFPIITDELPAISFPLKTYSSEYGHRRYMQERFEDLADKLESGAEQFERKLAIARKAKGGSVDPVVVTATAVSVMMYAARIVAICEQLRTLAGDSA